MTSRKFLYFMSAMALAIIFTGTSAMSKPLIYLPLANNSEWHCVQDDTGTFSHTGNLKYSFDFDLGVSKADSSNPAYGKWLFSPVKGTVTKVVSNIPDFQYNDANYKAKNNYGYGNEVIIKIYKANSTDTQYYVRLLHFKQNSIVVAVGDNLEVGYPLGKVGMTGFSTGPHVHVHVSTDSAGTYSKPFNFVEGPVKAGNWYRSENTTFSNFMDNNKEVNLGSRFTYLSTLYSSAWSSSTGATPFSGSNYMITKTAYQPFRWIFKVNKSGTYMVMVRYTAHSNRDPNTRYMLAGKSFTIDQTKAADEGWVPLGFVYLSSGTEYKLSVEGTTSGKYVSADSFDLIGS